jgi:anti-sigma B factor antagonist
MGSPRSCATNGHFMRYAWAHMGNDWLVPGFDEAGDYRLSIHLRRARSISGCLVLSLRGYFTEATCGIFQKQVTRAIEAGYTRLIFDIGKYDMDSTIRADVNEGVPVYIGTFTAFLKAVKPIGGDLVFTRMNPKVHEILQLLGFAQFFTIYSTPRAGIRYFRMKHNLTSRGQPFPSIFSCPICGKTLKASKSGRFRCSGCKTILAIDPAGQNFLG